VRGPDQVDQVVEDRGMLPTVPIANGSPNTLDESGDNEVEVTLFRPGMKPKQIDD